MRVFTVFVCLCFQVCLVQNVVNGANLLGRLEKTLANGGSIAQMIKHAKPYQAAKKPAKPVKEISDANAQLAKVTVATHHISIYTQVATGEKLLFCLASRPVLFTQSENHHCYITKENTE